MADESRKDDLEDGSRVSARLLYGYFLHHVNHVVLMSPVFATDKINVELLPPGHVVLDLSLGKVSFIDLPDCRGKFGCIFKNQSVASPQIVAILRDRP